MGELIKTLTDRLRQKALDNGKVMPDYLVVTGDEWDEYIELCFKELGWPTFVMLDGIMCPMFNGKPLILEDMIK